MPTADADVLARLGRGDVDAALEFEARFAPPLLAFFGCLLRGDPMLAADLCLETLATARLRASWFDGAPGEVGAWLLEQAAAVLRASGDDGTVISGSRRRGCVPEPAELTREDLNRIERLAADRRGMRGFGEPATSAVERELARAPTQDVLKRLRGSGLVRQVGAWAPTSDLDRWDDAQ
jgi:hypothetical protein